MTNGWGGSSAMLVVVGFFSEPLTVGRVTPGQRSVSCEYLNYNDQAIDKLKPNGIKNGWFSVSVLSASNCIASLRSK
jgi:hypothetical protein